MKLCTDCNKTLPLSQFTKKASCKDGHEPRCKPCRSIRYNKSTPTLLAKKMFATQCLNSINRGHPLPTYSLQEFESWMVSQPNFNSMYSAWGDSGYPKDLAPSADRLDPNTPYSLSNLELITWQENRSRGANSKKNNELLVNHRAVAAYNKDGTLHKEYPSMAEAMREFGGKATQSWGISSVCDGVPVKDGRGHYYTPRTYKGFTWKWM